MKLSILCAVGLLLVFAFAQAGCGGNQAAAPEGTAPETSTAVRGSGAGGSSILAPVSVPVTLPEGTILAVRTTSTMSTNIQSSGQSFVAHLTQPLLLNGREIAGRGAEVEGRIADADKGGRVKNVATIAVQLTRLRLVDGKMIDISTNTLTIEADSTKGKDATKIGIGSGVGAAIGAIAGGGKGAAIGAATGAGAGTGVVLATRGDPAVIPSESVLSFTLRSPATIAALR